MSVLKTEVLEDTVGSNPTLSYKETKPVVQRLERAAHNGKVAGSNPARLICASS